MGPALGHPIEDVRETLELILARAAERTTAKGSISHVRSRKLWHCRRGAWSCVVLAKTSASALRQAESIWETAEGWETDNIWFVDEGEAAGGAVLVGWA